MKKLALLVLCIVSLCAWAGCPGPQPQPLPPAPTPVADAAPPPEPTPAPTVVVDAGPAPAPVVDAGPPPAPTTPVGLACANLAKIACAAGMNGCAAALQHIVDAKLTAVDLNCLTLAKDKPTARLCKPKVACP